MDCSLLSLTGNKENTMLAKYYRFHVLNSTDQTLTYDSAARISVSYIPYKFVAGVLTYAEMVTDAAAFLTTGGSIAATVSAEGTVVDNSTNLYLGLCSGLFKVIADVDSTDGTIYLYIEESPDNTNWPSDQADFNLTEDCRMIAALTLSTDAEDEARACNFEV